VSFGQARESEPALAGASQTCGNTSTHTANWEQAAEEAPTANNNLHAQHDLIAHTMWVEYQRILEERHVFGNDDNDVSDDEDDEYDKYGLD
jgi:hypothetical protein